MVATWNLERPSRRPIGRTQRIHSALSAVPADIWILTETRTSVSPGLAFHPTHSKLHQDRRPADERWVSIWSRWPASKLAEDFWSATALINTPLGKLIVHGVVLPYMHEPAPGAAPVWSRFREELASQRKSWVRTRSQHPDLPLIVAGDLNQTLGGSRRYGSPATRDELLQALSEAELMCLTVGDEPTGQLRGIHLVDHICATSHLTTGSHYRVWGPNAADGSSMSDHTGVAIVFTRADRFTPAEDVHGARG
jgi:hypothetical protein